MRDKKKLTEELIRLLPEEDRVSLSATMHTWWFNIRRTGGMRLTSLGHQVFVEELELEHYAYNIDDPTSITQQIILKLDRQMQMPYYIHAVKGIPKKLVFFGSKEAVMINLYRDLTHFLDNYKP